MSQKEKKEITKIGRIVFFCLFFNLFFIGVLLLIIKDLPPIIPLYYGAPIGHDQLAGKTAIFIPTIVSLTGILINIVFDVRTNDAFLKKVFEWSSLFLTFLSFYTTLRIILLVGNFH